MFGAACQRARSQSWSESNRKQNLFWHSLTITVGPPTCPSNTFSTKTRCLPGPMMVSQFLPSTVGQYVWSFHNSTRGSQPSGLRAYVFSNTIKPAIGKKAAITCAGCRGARVMANAFAGRRKNKSRKDQKQRRQAHLPDHEIL